MGSCLEASWEGDLELEGLKIRVGEIRVGKDDNNKCATD